MVVAAGQLPAPSQLAALVCTPAAQLCARQLVLEPGRVQAALVPSHEPAHVPEPAQPVCPALGAPLTNEQVPAEVPLQYSHEPEHARLQQTPSAQNLDEHSSALVQGCPLALVAVHLPALQ